MSEKLVLFSAKTSVFHFRVTADLTDPDRLVRAAVTHYKHRAIATRVMPWRDWNHLAEMRGEERDKLLWFPLMNKLMYFSSVIDGVLEYGASHGWTQAVFHGGHLDGVHERVGTDGKGFPAREKKAPVPPRLEDVIFSMDIDNDPCDTFGQEVRYERERLPREDALWHYNKR